MTAHTHHIIKIMHSHMYVSSIQKTLQITVTAISILAHDDRCVVWGLSHDYMPVTMCTKFPQNSTIKSYHRRRFEYSKHAAYECQVFCIHLHIAFCELQIASAYRKCSSGAIDGASTLFGWFVLFSDAFL